ncbi:MAG TPA: NRDE family protein, partial [Steroidobacteraceae bacterium]|nr:NRDE family protein [Steroidobacteraceae bacterium]
LLAWHTHPRYPVVLAANRDEFFARPAAPAHWWTTPPMLAGRDLTAGGTWLAVNRRARFAALTNYRDPQAQRSNAPSRGTLVPAAVASERSVRDQLSELSRNARPYNGFNLLLSDGHELAVYESVGARGQVLGPGVYGLSNHLLDTPWPKVIAAKAALAAALAHLPDWHALLALLRDEVPAAEADLPRTGLSLEWEQLLSSAFIRAPGYGTRCSTILTIDGEGHARFGEWTWNEQAVLSAQVSEEFQCRLLPVADA